MIYRKHRHRQLEVSMDVERITGSDFTLMIENYPRVYLTKTAKEVLMEIQRIFKIYEERVGSVYTYDVIKINIARPLYTEKLEKLEQRKSLEKEMFQKQEVFRNWIKYRKTSKDFPIPMSERNRYYEDYIKFYTEKYDIKEVHEV